MLMTNTLQKEISVKLVYCGAPESGKASTLAALHRTVQSTPGNKTPLLSFGEGAHRSSLFGFAPREGSLLEGYRLTVLVFTVSADTMLNHSCGMALDDADGIAFVVDSQKGKMAENMRYFDALHQGLSANRKSLASVPHVIQYNKQDLPNVLPVEGMERIFNLGKVKSAAFPTDARAPKGIIDPFDHLLDLVRMQVARQGVNAPVRTSTVSA